MSVRRIRFAASLLLCTGAVALTSAVVAPTAAPAAHQHVRQLSPVRFRRLPSPRRFASCAGLVRYASRHFAQTHAVPETPVRPVDTPSATPTPGGTTNAPAPTAQGVSSGTSGTTYSTTNNQEQGVDEPDTVKTDGSTIFAVSGSRLEAVAVDGAKPQLASSLDLGPSGYGSQLLLTGNHLLVISGHELPMLGVAQPGGAAIVPSPYYDRAQTTVTNVNVSDPAHMWVVSTLTVDGSFVDGRMNGGTARLVLSSAPSVIEYPALAHSARGYLPTWRFHSNVLKRHFAGRAIGCRQVARPAIFSGVGMVTILTVDIPHGLVSTTATGLMADAQVVYGSTDNLYLATERWIDPSTPVADLPSEPTTQIDQFDVTNPDATTFVASGTVPGYLLNQFSMSEFGGYLRVATTSSPDWWGGTVPTIPSESEVSVLRTEGSRLAPVGALSGLGTGQRIYSVRFVGDAGYVVTFRRVDPLYTLDLSRPALPRVAGQLELEGYSAYLHPLGNGLLLGVGNDVGANNEPSGAMLELFDVSDPAHPSLVQKTTLGQGSSSQVQYDHHAFLYWPPTSLAVLPLQIYPPYNSSPPQPAGGSTATSSTAPSSGGGFTGAVGFRLDPTGITEVGRISHPATGGYSPSITRSVVVGSALYTVSDEGILESRLSTLAPETFVPFGSPSGP